MTRCQNISDAGPGRDTAYKREAHDMWGQLLAKGAEDAAQDHRRTQSEDSMTATKRIIGLAEDMIEVRLAVKRPLTADEERNIAQWGAQETGLSLPR